MVDVLLSLWDSIPVIDDVETPSPGLDDYGISGMDPINDRVDMWALGFVRKDNTKEETT